MDVFAFTDSLESSLGVPRGSLLPAVAAAGVGIALVAMFAPTDGSGTALRNIEKARAWRDERMTKDEDAVRKVRERLTASSQWPSEEAMLTSSATALASKIRSGELTSEACVAFFCDRVLELNGAINAVTETRFREALQEAREVDKAVAAGSSHLG